MVSRESSALATRPQTPPTSTAIGSRATECCHFIVPYRNICMNYVNYASCKYICKLGAGRPALDFAHWSWFIVCDHLHSFQSCTKVLWLRHRVVRMPLKAVKFVLWWIRTTGSIDIIRHVAFSLLLPAPLFLSFPPSSFPPSFFPPLLFFFLSLVNCYSLWLRSHSR